MKRVALGAAIGLLLARLLPRPPCPWTRYYPATGYHPDDGLGRPYRYRCALPLGHGGEHAWADDAEAYTPDERNVLRTVTDNARLLDSLGSYNAHRRRVHEASNP